MPTFTITDVSSNVRDWNSQQGGPMKEYRVHLTEGDQRHMNVEWSRKATSPAPTEGQQVEGTLEDRGQHGLKLKVAPPFGGGGFAGGGPEDPKRAARIVRQHSQEMALNLLALRYEPEQVRALTGEELMKIIKDMTDWFEKDAHKAAE